jgi:hypothetical protein
MGRAFLSRAAFKCHRKIFQEEPEHSPDGLIDFAPLTPCPLKTCSGIGREPQASPRLGVLPLCGVLTSEASHCFEASMSGARPSRFAYRRSIVEDARDLDMQTIAELAAVALSRGEQRASFFRGLGLNAPLFRAGDEHGGVKSLLGGLLLQYGHGHGIPRRIVSVARLVLFTSCEQMGNPRESSISDGTRTLPRPLSPVSRI